MATQKKKRSKASDFKKNKAAIDLELPSGNVCFAKRKTLDVFLAEGVIPNSLMQIIQQQLDETEGKTNDLQGELQKVASDPDKLRDIMALADAITVGCVKEPMCLSNLRSTGRVDEDGRPIMEVIPEADRDEELLYVDEVDMDDKMFIFQWAVGGTASVERFRSEQAALVADLSGSEEVERPTE